MFMITLILYQPEAWVLESKLGKKQINCKEAALHFILLITFRRDLEQLIELHFFNSGQTF